MRGSRGRPSAITSSSPPPPAQPAASPVAELRRTTASGVVLELATGLPSLQQLEAVDAVLKLGSRGWLYWPAENAVECIDEEKAQSLRRHIRDVGRLRTIGLRIDRMSEIWQRGPTGLRWIYRGEFPVRRSDILVKLTQLTMRAQPLLLMRHPAPGGLHPHRLLASRLARSRNDTNRIRTGLRNRPRGLPGSSSTRCRRHPASSAS